MKFIVSSVLCLAVINPFVASEGPLTRCASATKANISSHGLCGIPPNKSVKQVALGSFEMSCNPKMCDECIVVKSKTRSTVALVTDRCNECSESEITLNEDAYNALGGDDKPEINVSLIQVKCPKNLNGTGIKLPLHKDSNKTWAAFYVVDVKDDKPITVYSREYDGSHGNKIQPWIPLNRSTSNFYIVPQKDGMFYPIEVRVFGENGKYLGYSNLDPTDITQAS